MKIKTNILFFIVLLLIFNKANLSAQSAGCKLAIISDGNYHTEQEPIVKRYNNIITQLDVKYVETKEQIVDMTSACKNLLVERGVSEPLINVMEGINTLRDTYTKTKKYSDNVGCYIILRTQGFSHSSVLKNLQDLLSAMSMESVMKSIGG